MDNIKKVDLKNDYKNVGDLSKPIPSLSNVNEIQVFNYDPNDSLNRKVDVGLFPDLTTWRSLIGSKDVNGIVSLDNYQVLELEKILVEKDIFLPILIKMDELSKVDAVKLLCTLTENGKPFVNDKNSSFAIQMLLLYNKCNDPEFYNSASPEEIKEIIDYLNYSGEKIDILDKENLKMFSAIDVMNLISTFSKYKDLYKGTKFESQFNDLVESLNDPAKYTNMSEKEAKKFEEMAISQNFIPDILKDNNFDNISKADIESIIGHLSSDGKLLVNGKGSKLEASITSLIEYNKYRSRFDNSVLKPSQRKEAISFANEQINLGVKYNGIRLANGYLTGGAPAYYDVPAGELKKYAKYPDRESRLACNGLTRWAYFGAGIDIPDASYDQIAEAPIVTSTGRVSDMTPGDIIVFDELGRRSDITNIRIWPYRHVALYEGDGKMIEATNAHELGTEGGVREVPIKDNEYSYSITW